MVSKRIVPLVTLFVLAFALSVAAGCSSGSSKSKPAPEATKGSSTTTARPAIGPQATVDPKSVPPGNQVVVSGSGWPALSPVSIVAEDNPNNGPPYAQVTTDNTGSFTTHFRMEKAPDGSTLKTGRFWLVAKGATTSVEIPFQIETARPVRNPGDGG